MHRNLIVAVLLFSTTSFAQAQQVFYPNIAQFFAKNSYGTFAFVLGVKRSENIRRGPFSPIKEGQVFSVPPQQGYCFVIQHQGGSPVGASYKYTFDVYAADIETGEKTPIDFGYTRPYEITDYASRKMPSYCLRRRGRNKFWFEVSTTDGNKFDGNYEIVVR